MDEKKYDGSGSIWGYIPEALPGIAQLVTAFKGNAQPQNVTYVQQAPTSSFAGNSMVWIIIAIVVLIIILMIAFKGGKEKGGTNV